MSRSSWSSEVLIVAWSLSWSRVRICWPLCRHRGSPSDRSHNPRKWSPKWSSARSSSGTWAALRCPLGSCPPVCPQRGSPHKSCGWWTSARSGPRSLPLGEEARPPAAGFSNRTSLERNRTARPIHLQTTAATESNGAPHKTRYFYISHQDCGTEIGQAQHLWTTRASENSAAKPDHKKEL